MSIISIFLFPYSVAIHRSGVKTVETGKVSALPILYSSGRARLSKKPINWRVMYVKVVINGGGKREHQGVGE